MQRLGFISASFSYALLLGLLLPAVCLAVSKPAFSPPQNPETVFFLEYGVNKDGRESFKATTRVWRAGKRDKTVLAYRHEWPEKSWALATDGQGNPFRMVYTENGNALRLKVSGNGTVRLTGFWKGERIEETKTFPPPLSLETCLVLQHLEGRRGEVLEFELIRTEELPTFTSRRMRFEVQSFEKIKVPAGEFDCMVLHLTTANPVLRPFYSGKMYVTNDERRMLVKSENIPKDAKLELLRMTEELESK